MFEKPVNPESLLSSVAKLLNEKQDYDSIRKDRIPVTIYLVGGVKLIGKIRSFDKYSILLESNSQQQLIFKSAIATVVSSRSVLHIGHRTPAAHVADKGQTDSSTRDKLVPSVGEPAL